MWITLQLPYNYHTTTYVHSFTTYVHNLITYLHITYVHTKYIYTKKNFSYRLQTSGLPTFFVIHNIILDVMYNRNNKKKQKKGEPEGSQFSTIHYHLHDILLR